MSSEEFQKLSIQTKPAASPGTSPGAQAKTTSTGTTAPSPGQNLALGSLNAARGKPAMPAQQQPPVGMPAMGNLDPETLARISKFAGRNKSPAGTGAAGGSMTPGGQPELTIAGGLAAKRGNAPALKLGGGTGLGARRGPMMKLPTSSNPAAANPQQTAFSKYADVVDSAGGSLKFKGAVLSSTGVNFGNGREFKANIDDFEKLDELGKGNYGTVWRVIHKLSKKEMAMKEIRLSLEESVFSSIIMELDVLHKAACPEIVEFYGAFFVEGCVYILMEFMNCGSLEKIFTTDVEEGVLAKITLSTVRGLRTLKDKHNIIHRDVKPTNILVNSLGEVKLCDFGVSGNLVASIAKTNIGCQSYMAPERIKSDNPQLGPSTYTVQSDIWSLGLSILELAKGGYPYPPETYNNIFAQLQAITDGEPPELQEHIYSEEARDFVKQCLNKQPSKRPPYAVLLQHPWLTRWASEEVDMAGWIKEAQVKTKEEKARGKKQPTPAMHSFNTAEKTALPPSTSSSASTVS